jgi:hypothetical protein
VAANALGDAGKKEKKQIPRGNDRKKGKDRGNRNGQYGGPSPSLRSRVRMTTKNKQRRGQLQRPIQGSFAPLRMTAKNEQRQAQGLQQKANAILL